MLLIRTCSRAHVAKMPPRWLLASIQPSLVPALTSSRLLHSSQPRQIIPGAPTPFDDLTSSNEEEDSKSSNDSKKDSKNSDKAKFKDIMFKLLETAGIMVASLSMLGLAGFVYHRSYKEHSLKKMELAFTEGNPAFELAIQGRRAQTSDPDLWIVREHQKLLDSVISGETVGRYYLVIGEKGTGKASMLLEAMRKTNSLCCTFLNAHADPEIFRIRLGKALNFEFHEDYLGSLFSIRGPRDTTALLDIERAFNTLETVAVRHIKRHNRPLILIINSAHLIRDDEQGQSLLELLQQKAEALSGAGLVTVIFNSDDYWLYERLKQLGTRLDVLTINDFSRDQSVQVLKSTRKRLWGEQMTSSLGNEVYNLIGGRPQHLAAVASQIDMIKACHNLIDKEKTWFLNQCGLLGETMDDDVMESGKFSTSAMLLMRELVNIDREKRAEAAVAHALGETTEDPSLADHKVPRIPLWRARQIMTRPDYIQQYDNLNLFTLDSMSRVKADSVVMMQAFHEVASLPGFDELLEETCDRVSAIESLGRTRELVAKDLVLKGSYRISRPNKNGDLVISLNQPEEDDGDENNDHYALDRSDERFWWKRRADKFRSHKRDEHADSDLQSTKLEQATGV